MQTHVKLPRQSPDEAVKRLLKAQIDAREWGPVFLEYPFAPPRRWRFDVVVYGHNGMPWAIEIEGGVFTNGRHTRGAGFLKDMEKYNEAALRSWRLLRVTPDMVQDGTALLLVERALKVEL